MISLTFVVALLFGSPTGGGAQDTVLTRRLTRDRMVIEFTPADSGIAAELVGTLDSGRSAVEAFFGGRYRTAFTVRIHPSRAALTADWARAWGVPDLKTECWMVASGVGDELALLSPRVWGTEACEHAVTDTASTRRIFWHELVHVYHGQHNPRPTFDGMDDLG